MYKYTYLLTIGAIRRAKHHSPVVTTNKPTLNFLQARCSACWPTNSVKALKGEICLHKCDIIAHIGYSYRTDNLIVRHQVTMTSENFSYNVCFWISVQRHYFLNNDTSCRVFMTTHVTINILHFTFSRDANGKKYSAKNAICVSWTWSRNTGSIQLRVRSTSSGWPSLRSTIKNK